ncbi:MAG TPA: extracellular solute-binding protein [Clostridiales bacterium]|nr:extracellular solute-binding protein [Clostridiales bacterium]
MKRKIAALLVLISVVLMLFSACSKADISSNKSSEQDGASSSSSTTDTSGNAVKQPDKIRVFYVTAGIATPDNFNFQSNVILDEIAKIANVEITEVIVPPSSDTITKYNLMMSSGNICDVVHLASKNTMINDGKNGAYVELSDIIKKSAIITERYLPYIDQLKADDGNIYFLISLPVDGDVNDGIAIRYDLLKDIGYSEIPVTMDEWLEAMRKLKSKYPDSIPYASKDTLFWCEFVFKSYGCAGDGYSWQYYKDKIIHTFENPLYKEAIKTYRLMLEEGLMDKEFVTTKEQDYQDKRLNNKVLVNPQNLASIGGWVNRYTENNITEAIFVPAQWAKIDDPRIDPRSVYEGPLPLGTHCMGIASTSKQKDASIRFIEALLSDKGFELSVWGREGIEFNIVDGKKVLNFQKSNETNWRFIYNMLFGYNTKEKVEVQLKTSIANTKFDDEGKREYERIYWEQFDKVYADANSVLMNPMKFIILEPDTTTRRTEARNEARTIAVKVILGELTFEEFDVQASNFLKKYQFITDEYNQKLPAAKKRAGQ